MQINKISKLNKIFNKILKIILFKISNHLEQIFINFFLINYYSAYFKEFIIIIFYKKRYNRNFINLKNYQFINLFNTIKKIIKVILIARINYLAIIYNFLSKTHFKGQHKLCIEIIIYHLLKKI